MKNKKKIERLTNRLTDVAAQVTHENELLNHRLTWMWTLQGLLFTAYSVLYKENFAAGVICIVGLASCISIGYSLAISVKVLDILNPLASDLRSEIDTCLGRNFSGLTGKSSVWAFLFPWKFLPKFMGIVWIVLLFNTFPEILNIFPQLTN